MATVRCAALVVLVLGLALAQPGSAAQPRASEVIFLDDGAIRLGVDLGDGGTITYLARSGPGGRNLIHDVQPTYSGPGWRVSASGARVAAYTSDARTIYVRSVPTVDGRPCPCSLETWVTLNGAAADVRTRFTNSGLDTALGGPASVELPALSTTGTAYRLFSYDGTEPYTGAAIRRLAGAASFPATEHWAALVGPGGRGVGVFVPELTRFGGAPGSSAAIDNAGAVNGSVSATALEILDSNVVYSSSYTLIVGTVHGIRTYAVAHRPDPRPAFRFDGDRRHWRYLNTSDDGFPPAGALRLRIDKDDPQLLGPEQWWSTRNAPRLYVRGAWHTRHSLARLSWSVPAGSRGARGLEFFVVPDGRFRTYRLDLGRRYRGIVTGLRLDPVDRAEVAGFVDVSCISWKPCPVDRELESRLESRPLSNPFTETFDGPLAPFWHVSGSGTGSTVAPTGGRLEVTFSPDGEAGPPGGWLGAHIGTNCHLRGDFDVQVDYALPVWPEANGVNAFMRTYYGPEAPSEGILRESERWGETYGMVLHGPGLTAPTDDRSGGLRLARTGATISAYYWTAAGWQLISSGAADTRDATITLGGASGPAVFVHQTVKLAFDNFRVTSGLLICPF